MARYPYISEGTFTIVKSLLSCGMDIDEIKRRTKISDSTIEKVAGANSYEEYRNTNTPDAYKDAELLKAILAQVAELNLRICRISKALGVEDGTAD